MWSIFIGLWLLIVIPIVITTNSMGGDHSSTFFLSIGSGLLLIAFGVKQEADKSKLRKYLNAIQDNFNLILKKLDEGKSLELIAEEMKKEQGVPEVLTVKMATGVMMSLIDENLIQELIDPNQHDKVVEKLGLIHILSEPFQQNKRTLQEEIHALDEYENVFYQQEKVVLIEKGENEEEENRGAGTLILTTRYLLWFPSSFDFKGFLRDNKTHELLGKLTEQIPFLGLGINTIFLIDSIAQADKTKTIYTEKRKEELLKEAAENEKFRFIPLSEVKGFEFQTKLRKRLLDKSFTICTSDGHKFALSCLEKGGDFVADLFEQVKLTTLLHNKIMLPEDLDNPGKWSDFYTWDEEHQE